MRKNSNGITRDMTPEECSAWQAEEERIRLQEQTRPFTDREVMTMVLAAQINTLAADDNTALRMKAFYPAFEALEGQTVKQGFRFLHDGRLWRVVQPELTLQKHYPPGTGTESLYTEVCETHAGTRSDPIPYRGNLALETGRYYLENGVLYRCHRDTVSPVFQSLEALSELYVTAVGPGEA